MSLKPSEATLMSLTRRGYEECCPMVNDEFVKTWALWLIQSPRGKDKC